MKLNSILLILAISTICMSTPLKGLILESGSNIKDEEDLQQLKDAENALDMVNNRDWISVAQVLPQLLGDILDDFQCFKDAAMILLIKGNNDTRQCVLDHLKIVYADLKLALEDLFKRKRGEAKQKLQHALETIQDIQNC